ncbi:MAG: PKD domain-containing protein [Bacteroidetes bacterium]|nr:PKD domain-containing protein [Bacteroidota bacterium]
MKPTTTLSAWLIAISMLFAVRTNAQSCNANFIYWVVAQDSITITIQFMDSSVYPDNSFNHTWYFGDGGFSNAVDPMHAYDKGQTYYACLWILDSNSVLCDSMCYPIQTIPPQACNASFWFSPQFFTFSFTDYSTNASSWAWDFGDGNTSSLQNPLHTYSVEGNYNVCLTIADTGSCTDSYCYWVWAGCWWDSSGFYYSASGTTVQFNASQDSTISSLVYSWNFGDGNYSNLINPLHTYSTFGTYNVCLSVQDTSGTCSDTFCQAVTVNCLDAQFGYGQNYSQKYTFTFNDNTNGNITSWLWSFGDEATDTTANPTHTYLTYGYYLVCLTVSTDSCTDQYCQNIWMECCEVDFAYSYSGASVNFDLNTDSGYCGFYNTYEWNFGDGFSGTQSYYDPYIQHTYSTPGIYTVCLSGGSDTIYYQNCWDTICKNIVVELGDTCAGLQVDIGGFGVRPQIQTSFVIHYCNYGNTQADNTTFTIDLNSLIIPNSASPSWSSLSGNSVTWNLGSLAAGDCGDITLYVTGDASAQMGDVLCSDALISSSTDECDTSDNSIQACFNVVNSFDPNDKRMEAKDFAKKGYVENDTIFPSDKKLTYMIRFQNTGTAPAINIFVYDTLDATLNPATVLAGASSHAYDYFEITGNVIKWSFLNIILADSTNNEPASHGFVKFSIEQTAGNPMGTIIPNHAGIVFDFNVPVITNEAIVIVDSLTPVMDLTGAGKLSSYPNPVRDEVALLLPENFHPVQIKVADVTGRVVYYKEVTKYSAGGSKFLLSLSHLFPGVYGISVTGTDGTRLSAVLVKQ